MFDLNFNNYTENYYCTRYVPPPSIQQQKLQLQQQSSYHNSNFPPSSTTNNMEFDSSSDDDSSGTDLFELIVKGYLTTGIATFGILGNIISIIILTRPKMKTNSLNQLLLGLSVCDLLLLINTIFIMGLDAIFDYYGVSTYTNIITPHLLPYMYPIGTTAQTGSIYFTFIVTIERWLAVCWPLKAKSICTLSRAKLSSVLVAIFAICYNIPKWYEYKTGKFGPSYYTTLMTKLRCNGTYIKIYINWSNLFIIYLIPICSLVILNCIIYLQVRRTNATRQLLTKNQSNELSLAVMLLVVVLVYLLCNILPFVNNFMESTTGDPIQELVDLSNLLVTFNSSVNCIIYCTLGSKFRKQFFLLINCKSSRSNSFLLKDQGGGQGNCSTRQKSGVGRKNFGNAANGDSCKRLSSSKNKRNINISDSDDDSSLSSNFKYGHHNKILLGANNKASSSNLQTHDV